MSGQIYISARDALRLTRLAKSGFYKLIQKGHLIAETEQIGTGTRHKILAPSLLIWLAAKQKFHQDEANNFKASYSLLEKMFKHV